MKFFEKVKHVQVIDELGRNRVLTFQTTVPSMSEEKLLEIIAREFGPNTKLVEVNPKVYNFTRGQISLFVEKHFIPQGINATSYNAGTTLIAISDITFMCYKISDPNQKFDVTINVKEIASFLKNAELKANLPYSDEQLNQICTELVDNLKLTFKDFEIKKDKIQINFNVEGIDGYYILTYTHQEFNQLTQKSKKQEKPLFTRERQF
jgi:hypothetical protein